MIAYHTEIMRFEGVDVKVSYYFDDDSEPPWEHCDGHGPVRRGEAHHPGRSDKHPGERPLNNPGWHQCQYYYDWRQACRLARRDGWNAEPYDAPNRVLRSVQSDFDFLRGWVNDDWQYVGVEVQVVDENGDLVGDCDACWGFETYRDYHRTAAKEMAQCLAASYKGQLAEATRFVA